MNTRNLCLIALFLAGAIFAAACGMTSNSANSGGPGSAMSPSITTQPADQTVTAGQIATFTVTAAGTAPLSYQWQKGNANIAGATSASYTTPATTMTDNNSTYRVVVSNSAGSITSNPATLTVSATPVKPTITTQPVSQTVTAGQTATFSVAATGNGTLTYQWQKGSTPANISGATSSTYTTPATTAADNGTIFRVVVTDSAGSTTSNTATLTVNAAPPPSSVKVLTFHNDNGRTGQNLNETILTTANVKTATFGKLGFLPVDGLVDAEPLYVSNLTVAGSQHNVVFVATEHDSVYAFDADSFSPLWKVTVLGSGETTSDDRSCSQIEPEIGITSTPVIDVNQGAHGTIFVVAMSKSGSTYFHRLHALDLTTGAEQSGSPTTIQATFQLPGAASPVTTFAPAQYKERSALMLLNGTIYTTWASHCDAGAYGGWIMGYSESSLQQTSVLNITPNGSRGAFWGAAAGPSADGTNFYVLSGNGTFDGTLDANGFPTEGDFGNGFLKIAPSANSMSVSDYFMMHDSTSESSVDTDLGSGGSMVLPDLTDSLNNTWHLAVGAGKDGRIYVVNRDMMGKFNTSNDSGIYQELDGALPGGVWSTSAYFNKFVYYGPRGNPLRAFSISNAKLSTSPSSTSSHSYGYPGATPSISADGTSNGILWVVENGSTGVLHAYDATNLATELYNSNQNAADTFTTNSSCKYVTPMIANGQVFVGTNTGVVVFGLR